MYNSNRASSSELMSCAWVIMLSILVEEGSLFLAMGISPLLLLAWSALVATSVPAARPEAFVMPLAASLLRKTEIVRWGTAAAWPGSHIAVRAVPEMIARWVPGGLIPLGTDGYGRSETRAALRRFFEVDAECIALAALSRLARRALLDAGVVEHAIHRLGVDTEKINPKRT
jgi:hypothetical protein